MYLASYLPARSVMVASFDTVQAQYGSKLNLGYGCNQSCVHCHVNAGPNRKEEMTAETIDAVIEFLAASPEITAIDLTGGAPELNRNFRRLVIAARSRGLRVIDRCNLTILEEPGHECPKATGSSSRP